jgi:hypothetical protein
LTEAINILCRERDELIHQIRQMRMHAEFLKTEVEKIESRSRGKIEKAQELTDALVELGWRDDESHRNT